MRSPIEAYKRAQRELRRDFDAFTRVHCPNCPTPCCRRPARIVPADILLAEATGWRASLPTTDAPNPDMPSEIAGRVADALGAADDAADATAGLPCEYLGERGCSFPSDLRPFGCATYVCKYMRAELDRRSLTRIKRLVRELETSRADLMRTLDRLSEDENV